MSQGCRVLVSTQQTPHEYLSSEGMTPTPQEGTVLGVQGGRRLSKLVKTKYWLAYRSGLGWVLMVEKMGGGEGETEQTPEEEGHTAAWGTQDSVAGGHQAGPVRRTVRGVCSSLGLPSRAVGPPGVRARSGLDSLTWVTCSGTKGF